MIKALKLNQLSPCLFLSILRGNKAPHPLRRDKRLTEAQNSTFLQTNFLKVHAIQAKFVAHSALLIKSRHSATQRKVVFDNFFYFFPLATHISLFKVQETELRTFVSENFSHYSDIMLGALTIAFMCYAQNYAGIPNLTLHRSAPH